MPTTLFPFECLQTNYNNIISSFFPLSLLPHTEKRKFKNYNHVDKKNMMK